LLKNILSCVENVIKNCSFHSYCRIYKAVLKNVYRTETRLQFNPGRIFFIEFAYDWLWFYGHNSTDIRLIFWLFWATCNASIVIRTVDILLLVIDDNVIFACDRLSLQGVDSDSGRRCVGRN